MKRTPKPQEQARMLVQMFAEQEKPPTYQQALNFIARLNGHKSWSVMQAVRETVSENASATAERVVSPSTAYAWLRRLAQELVNTADDTGCSDDLTVVDAQVVEALEEWLDSAEESKTADATARTVPDHEVSVAGFGVDDVLTVRPDLSAEQAVEVLYHCERRFDAGLGMNWDMLELQSREVFGPFGIDAELVEGNTHTSVFIRLDCGRMILGSHQTLNGTQWWDGKTPHISPQAYVVLEGNTPHAWTIGLDGAQELHGGDTQHLYNLAETFRNAGELLELKGPASL